jgi:hypothetical protein
MTTEATVSRADVVPTAAFGTSDEVMDKRVKAGSATVTTA